MLRIIKRLFFVKNTYSISLISFFTKNNEIYCSVKFEESYEYDQIKASVILKEKSMLCNIHPLELLEIHNEYSKHTLTNNLGNKILDKYEVNSENGYKKSYTAQDICTNKNLYKNINQEELITISSKHYFDVGFKKALSFMNNNKNKDFSIRVVK